MSSSLSNIETADNDTTEVSRLADVQLSGSSIKTIKGMSSNMNYYSRCLPVFGFFWLLIIAFSLDDSDLMEEIFKITFVIIQAIVFLLIFQYTRRTASSFKIIVQDGNFSNLMPALEQLRKLYKLQRRVVVLVLMLIPVKFLVDIASHFLVKQQP